MLDQPVRLGLLDRRDPHHVAVAFELELRLGRLEHQRRPGRAPRLQRRGRRPGRGERLPPRVSPRAPPREDPVHLLVVEPLIRADHRAVERALEPASPRTTISTVTASRSCPGTSEQARSRAPRAASARPRRERRRWCRAGRPPGRPATAGRTYAETSAMCTHTRRAVALGRSAEIASSKSRARAGSIVNVGSERRSRRPPLAPTSTDSADLVRLVLDRGVERAPQPAIDHQRLDHVPRHVRPAEPPRDRGPAAGPRRSGASAGFTTTRSPTSPARSRLIASRGPRPKNGSATRNFPRRSITATRGPDQRRGAPGAHRTSAATVRSATVSA